MKAGRLPIVEFAVSILLLCSISLRAQDGYVRNVTKIQDTFKIDYSLLGNGNYIAELYYSVNNAETWLGPLDGALGDVGSWVSSGEYKSIELPLQADSLLRGVSDIQFYVKARPRRFFEPEMIYVSGGSFRMGCTDPAAKCDTSELPVHKVILSDFYIGRFEVTQNEWYILMGKNPADFTDCLNCPMQKVSMKDIQLYIDKLNIVTGKNYRLPTEAEWEFAARGGVKSNNYRFSGSNSADSVSWEIGNAQNSLHPVGIKKPNELGIYDMSGNVSEWCADYYTSYKKGYHINPKGKTAGSVYTIRGGSWKDTGTLGRVSCRGSAAPDSRENNIGFRLVLDAEESVPVKATFQYTVNNLTSE